VHMLVGSWQLLQAGRGSHVSVVVKKGARRCELPPPRKAKRIHIIRIFVSSKMLQVNLRDYASRFLSRRIGNEKNSDLFFGTNELNGVYLPPGILLLLIVAHIFFTYVAAVLLVHMLRSRSGLSLAILVAIFGFTYREYFFCGLF